MSFHRALVNAEIAGDMFIQLSAQYVRKNLTLWWSQLVETSAQLTLALAGLAVTSITFQRALHGP